MCLFTFYCSWHEADFITRQYILLKKIVCIPVEMVSWNKCLASYQPSFLPQLFDKVALFVFFSVEFLTPVCIFLIDSIYRVYIISDMCIPTEFGWRWNKSRKTGNIWSKYTTVVRVNTTLFY